MFINLYILLIPLAVYFIEVNLENLKASAQETIKQTIVNYLTAFKKINYSHRKKTTFQRLLEKMTKDATARRNQRHHMPHLQQELDMHHSNRSHYVNVCYDLAIYLIFAKKVIRCFCQTEIHDALKREKLHLQTTYT